MATIFTVDDDRAMLDMYREMLVMMNHELVAEAIDGHQAITIYKKFDKYPDIVLMDYRMPRRNGIETMQEIRRINPSQCIIFITSDQDAAIQARELGANTYVLKPFRLDTLSSTINQVLVNTLKK
ncbi:MAG: response regulator [Candidatus Thermoplasmatota archaeon]|nr:response regulator [Euryarchaeota archaeon]MBU4032180.1 response regulator [Candidatus Thermoplasmatota archaeon]MBU4071028.1 response regulator [Candidatus Thermoplasmatota archaeon]MBU4145111.1 response regulator [Candidatus Thermoplasmatota archaeon]MBU4591017.1 response regulator [Candidatus Thermoplasmatota archaeon]